MWYPYLRPWAALLGLALCGLLAACGAAQSRTAATPAPPAATAPPATPTSLAAESPPATAAAPCVREPVAAPAPGAASAAPEVSFEPDTNTIILKSGEQVGLAALSQALGQPELLSQLDDGTWLLNANLRVDQGAHLRIAAPEVRWLRLRSDDEGFISVRVIGGELEVDGACITSWDAQRGAAAEQYEDGRSYLLARDGAQMRIRNAEIRYLGFEENESYGLAWRLAGTTGELVDSIVSHNYYGMYSYEVADLLIRGNEIHHNVLYGVDPHTRSVRLRIEGNSVHNNGKHGIILADECTDSVVRDNLVFNNLHHGIVIYQGSDRTLVEGNRSYHNGDQGLNINDSNANMVRDNLIYGNMGAGIGVGQEAADNELVDNEVHDNGEDGVVLFSDARNTTLRGNLIGDNERYGIYIKTVGAARITENQIVDNRVGVYLKDTPVQVDPQANTIRGNDDGAIQREGQAG